LQEDKNPAIGAPAARAAMEAALVSFIKSLLFQRVLITKIIIE
jgi:hypothetical protein